MGIWTRKSIQDLSSSLLLEERQLRPVLGPLDLIMLGIGAVIGAGLFSLTGIAAAENAGPAITLAFLIAAIGCLCGTLLLRACQHDPHRRLCLHLHLRHNRGACCLDDRVESDSRICHWGCHCLY